MRKLDTLVKIQVKGGKAKPTIYKKLNNRIYHSGMISIAVVSSVANLTSAISDLYSDKPSNIYQKNKAADSIRPSFRFTDQYWLSSTTYGMPWYN